MMATQHGFYPLPQFSGKNTPVKSVKKGESRNIDFNEIRKYHPLYNGPQGLKTHKKNVSNLTIKEDELLKESISILSKFFSQKRNKDPQLILLSLQQFASIINIYQLTELPLNFTDQMIFKMRFILQEIEQNMRQFEDRMIEVIQKKYENQMNPILYIIVVLISKAQKQKNYTTFYQNHLKKLFNMQIIKILVNLPEFNQENNLKCYSLILGHIGQNFSKEKDKTHKPLINKIFKVFEKLKYSKNLYYLCNFLREQVQDFTFELYDVSPILMIRKMKQLIKQRFNTYQIATVMDVYNKLLVDNFRNHMDDFYDQEILDYAMNANSGLCIKFPTKSYKVIFYCAMRKYSSYITSYNGFLQKLGAEEWINEKIMQYCQLISISETNLEENCIFIENMINKINQLSVLTLMENGFMNTLARLCSSNNNSIIISGLHITKNMVMKLEEKAHMQYIISENIYEIVNELSSEINQFTVCELAKELKKQLTRLMNSSSQIQLD